MYKTYWATGDRLRLPAVKFIVPCVTMVVIRVDIRGMSNVPNPTLNNSDFGKVFLIMFKTSQNTYYYD